MAREVGMTVAIEALALAAGSVTMGVGTVAINALSASRFARLARLAVAGTEAGSMGRFAVAAVGQ